MNITQSLVEIIICVKIGHLNHPTNTTFGLYTGICNIIFKLYKILLTGKKLTLLKHYV